MIRGFGDRRTERFYSGQPESGLGDVATRAALRLTLLDNAESLQDLRALRSNRLELSEGGVPGGGALHSIRIDSRWRVHFHWGRGGPYDVRIADSTAVADEGNRES